MAHIIDSGGEMAVFWGPGAKERFEAALGRRDSASSEDQAPCEPDATAAPQIGDPDAGGVYVGLSASDGKPLHAALGDLPEYKTFDEALEAAEQLKSLHPTAHVPTPNELDKNLFENRNTGKLAGTFNTSGSFPASVYRSSAPYNLLNARVQYFGYGTQNDLFRLHRLPVRLVW